MFALLSDCIHYVIKYNSTINLSEWVWGDVCFAELTQPCAHVEKPMRQRLLQIKRINCHSNQTIVLQKHGSIENKRKIGSIKNTFIYTLRALFFSWKPAAAPYLFTYNTCPQNKAFTICFHKY
ncbi:unnamed protein product [Spodoptera littoralis]|uniref:Uncharacterized protein n=1 Tax=Spodoptera littoralis TaxID=7109 RepID=A0A9P0NAU9_SPOLI|nr:unnamed protein product [Spodoptera littoralis]CAH1647802.1 unnamed protein product [Spodoptera littoralis]